jgi:hypothetical protein
MPVAKSKKPTPAKSTKTSVAAAKTKKPSAATGARSKKSSAATARKPATAAKKPARKKAGSKREVIEPHKGDKRYVRRTAAGTFGKTVDMGKSLAADQRSQAKKKVPKGQGDRGDTRR